MRKFCDDILRHKSSFYTFGWYFIIDIHKRNSSIDVSFFSPIVKRQLLDVVMISLFYDI